MSELTVLKFRVDLHVHTRRYSPCAEALDPQRLPQVMAQRGLHGVVITEHDQLWPETDIEALNSTSQAVRIYRGVEVSSRNGHFVVIGLDESDGIKPGIGIGALVEIVQGRGAAIIWAHPHMHYSQIPEPLSVDEMPQGIHAVEVASSVTRGQCSLEAQAYADRMRCAAVGGSDAHSLGQVGRAFTLFSELPENEKSLATAIRNGRCKAQAMHHPLNGP
jgi:predicted metal-dependent phosphoesterase TrpH